MTSNLASIYFRGLSNCWTLCVEYPKVNKTRKILYRIEIIRSPYKHKLLIIAWRISCSQLGKITWIKKHKIKKRIWKERIVNSIKNRPISSNRGDVVLKKATSESKQNLSNKKGKVQNNRNIFQTKTQK